MPPGSSARAHRMFESAIATMPPLRPRGATLSARDGLSHNCGTRPLVAMSVRHELSSRTVRSRRSRRRTSATTAGRCRRGVVRRDAGHRGQRIVPRLSGRDAAAIRFAAVLLPLNTDERPDFEGPLRSSARHFQGPPDRTFTQLVPRSWRHGAAAYGLVDVGPGLVRTRRGPGRGGSPARVGHASGSWATKASPMAVRE